MRARGRDWLVIPGGADGMLRARPLGGSDAETTLLLPELDDPTPAIFAPPTVDDRGDAGSGPAAARRSEVVVSRPPAARSDPSPNSPSRPVTTNSCR